MRRACTIDTHRHANTNTYRHRHTRTESFRVSCFMSFNSIRFAEDGQTSSTYKNTSGKPNPIVVRVTSGRAVLARVRVRVSEEIFTFFFHLSLLGPSLRPALAQKAQTTAASAEGVARVRGDTSKRKQTVAAIILRLSPPMGTQLTTALIQFRLCTRIDEYSILTFFVRAAFCCCCLLMLWTRQFRWKMK